MLRLSCLVLALAAFQEPPPGETLPNGIRLPAAWPSAAGGPGLPGQIDRPAK